MADDEARLAQAQDNFKELAWRMEHPLHFTDPRRDGLNAVWSEEAVKERREQRGFNSGTLRDAFALFDADGDGKLTEDEVVAALTRKTGKGTELSEELARTMWRKWQFEFDLNNDGKISIEELAVFVPSDFLSDPKLIG